KVNVSDRHEIIGYDDVWFLALRDAVPLNAISGEQRFCSHLAKTTAEELPYVRIIIDDEDLRSSRDLVLRRMRLYVLNTAECWRPAACRHDIHVQTFSAALPDGLAIAAGHSPLLARTRLLAFEAIN